MRVACMVFRATLLCLAAALWCAASGCDFESFLDSSSNSSAKPNAAGAKAGSSSQEPPIKMSAGVALPQTGPTGTLMSFSVDYRFREGGPDAAAKYVWVVERSKGEPHRQPVQLNSSGNLRTFLPEWRPEEGPFRSHIAVVSDNNVLDNISGSIPLK